MFIYQWLTRAGRDSNAFKRGGAWDWGRMTTFFKVPYFNMYIPAPDKLSRVGCVYNVYSTTPKTFEGRVCKHCKQRLFAEKFFSHQQRRSIWLTLSA